MYDVNSLNYTLGIIYFLILFFILIICKNITTTSIEGFSGDDITRIAGQVGDILSKATEIPNKIVAIGTQIGNSVTGITSAVSGQITAAETRINNGIGTTISNTISTATNTGGVIGNAISTGATNAISTATGAGGTINKAIGDAIKGATNAGGVIDSAIKEVIRLALITFKTEVLDPIITGIMSIINPIVLFIADIKFKIMGLPNLITGIMETTFWGFEQTVIGPIMSFIADIKSKIMGLPNLITGIMETSFWGFEQTVMGPIMSFLADIKSKILGLPNLITGFFETLLWGFEQTAWEKVLRFVDNLAFLVTYTIVDPFLALFDAIKNLFAQLKKIADKVIHKIVILPNCVILYMVQSVLLSINAIYNYFMPVFLADLISTIYEYTLQVPLEYLSYLVGFDDWWDKCYNFNVSDELDSITSKFKAVGAEFVDSFGHIDWSVLIDFGDKDNRPKRAKKEATIVEKLNQTLDALEQDAENAAAGKS